MTLVAGSEIAADTIVMRQLKGSPLSTADFDWDLETLMDGINTNETGVTALGITVAAMVAIVSALGGATSYTMTAGQTALTVGVELTTSFLEVVFLSATGAEELQHINGSNSGDIKIFIMVNDNVTVVRNDSYIKTKNPLLNPNFDMDTGDVIGLVNNGGVSGTATNGTWVELFRGLQV
jgi:hypothetical protein